MDLLITDMQTSQSNLFPEGTTALCKAFRQSATWTVPYSGEYRLICIGRGGAGSICMYNASKAAVRGGGGGSGAWCEKVMELQKGSKLTFTIGATETKIVQGSTTIMSATRGSSGSGGYNGIVGVGGAGGTATGGDTNHNGLKGGDGTTGTSGSAVPGGNGAPAPDYAQLSNYLTGIYGVGGFAENNSSADGTTPNEVLLFGQTLSSGGGGWGIIC